MKLLMPLRVLFVCLLLSWANSGYAWGNLGHRITAEIAEPLLSAATRRQVRNLLDGESLADAATFMDNQRDTLKQRWRDSARWHYNNQPVCASNYHCPDGQCATAQIARMQTVLANSQAPRQERAIALRVLIHLVGDIHQPLHMADNNDRGGNDIAARMYAGAERTNLHAVLDTELIRQLVGRNDAHDYADQLTHRYQNQFATWTRGTPTNWAQESHELARREVYGNLPGFSCGNAPHHTITLPATYLNQARAYLPEQLTKAGVRIAAILNATLR